MLYSNYIYFLSLSIYDRCQYQYKYNAKENITKLQVGWNLELSNPSLNTSNKAKSEKRKIPSEQFQNPIDKS